MSGHRGAYLRGYYGGPNGDIYGLLAMVLIRIVALPLVGGYLLLTGKSEGSKILGGILLIIGLIVWVACGIN